MKPAILDINDVNLLLVHDSHRLRQPGYAYYDGRDYQFGESARALARLRPRDINTRYWWQLGTDPLQPRLGPARHTADLVHAHLQNLHSTAGGPAEILVGAPASMSAEQLSLLLGIMQQCPFNAVGLVNRSVALASRFDFQGTAHHLELQLHQAFLVEVQREEQSVVLGKRIPLAGCGLLQLQERLVETITRGFVRQTRFDPRRKAATEQQLYDLLPRTLEHLRSEGETDLEISGYRLRLKPAELQQAADQLLSAIAEALELPPADILLLLEEPALRLPGLAGATAGVLQASANSVPEAVADNQTLLLQRDTEALELVTTLPVSQDAATPEEGGISAGPAHNAPAEPPPTHWLSANRALPLAQGIPALSDAARLNLENGVWVLREARGVTVNGAEPSRAQSLGAGDVLQHTASGETFQLIRVES